MIDGGVTEASS